MLVLAGLRWFDYRMKQEQHGVLSLTTEQGLPTEEEIRATVGKAGYNISSISYVSQTEQRSSNSICNGAVCRRTQKHHRSLRNSWETSACLRPSGRSLLEMEDAHLSLRQSAGYSPAKFSSSSGACLHGGSFVGGKR
jgi:hypothetical protein